MSARVLTDCYVFSRIATKAKHRLDCTASTESYLPFEEKRITKAQRETEHRDKTNIGDLVIYLVDVPGRFGGDVHRKADKSITIKGKNLSSVYVPDITKGYAYGDVKGTDDALLFVFENFSLCSGAIEPNSTIKVYVARGQARNKNALCDLLFDGGLDDELEALFLSAVNSSK